MATDAQQFVEKHGYQKGTYEAQAQAMGYNLADIKSQGFDWGKNMNPGEFKKLTSKFESPIQQQRNQAVQNMNQAVNMNYEFDPQQYLPGIQQQAAAIYNPQQAQLEAIRQLQSAQYQEARVQTMEDFDQQLQGEIETINNRGAFFSGGAVVREQEIMDRKVQALNMLGLQASAADFSNLAQQGILAAEEAQFIQDRLYNAESSAYARFTDQRNFSFQAAVQQYQMYTDERDFARSVFESDRSFQMETEKMDMLRQEFKQTYALNEIELEKAKATFQYDIDTAKLTYEQALAKFKQTYAKKNDGILGLDGTTNEDLYEKLARDWDAMYGEGTTIIDGQGYSTSDPEDLVNQFLELNNN